MKTFVVVLMILAAMFVALPALAADIIAAADTKAKPAALKEGCAGAYDETIKANNFGPCPGFVSPARPGDVQSPGGEGSGSAGDSGASSGGSSGGGSCR